MCLSVTRYMSRMKKAQLREELVSKVTPERSFSVALHPDGSRIIAATGDKWGKHGVWDVESQTY